MCVYQFLTYPFYILILSVWYHHPIPSEPKGKYKDRRRTIKFSCLFFSTVNFNGERKWVTYNGNESTSSRDQFESLINLLWSAKSCYDHDPELRVSKTNVIRYYERSVVIKKNFGKVHQHYSSVFTLHQESKSRHNLCTLFEFFLGLLVRWGFVKFRLLLWIRNHKNFECPLQLHVGFTS